MKLCDLCQRAPREASRKMTLEVEILTGKPGGEVAPIDICTCEECVQEMRQRVISDCVTAITDKGEGAGDAVLRIFDADGDDWEDWELCSEHANQVLAFVGIAALLRVRP